MIHPIPMNTNTVETHLKHISHIYVFLHTHTHTQTEILPAPQFQQRLASVWSAVQTPHVDLWSLQTSTSLWPVAAHLLARQSRLIGKRRTLSVQLKTTKSSPSPLRALFPSLLFSSDFVEGVLWGVCREGEGIPQSGKLITWWREYKRPARTKEEGMGRPAKSGATEPKEHRLESHEGIGKPLWNDKRMWVYK